MTPPPGDRTWEAVLDALEARLAHHESALSRGVDTGFDPVPLPAHPPQGPDRVRAVVVLGRVQALEQRLRALAPARRIPRSTSPYT